MSQCAAAVSVDGFDQLAERVLDRAPLDTKGLATLRALRLAEARGRYEDWGSGWRCRFRPPGRGPAARDG